MLSYCNFRSLYLHLRQTHFTNFNLIEVFAQKTGSVPNIRPVRKVGPETRDFRWDPRPETRLPKGWTRDLRLGTLIVHGTQDPGHLSHVVLEIKDPYQDQKKS